MSKSIELRRHTDNDGDVLTDDGVGAALEIGRRLTSNYAVLVSSGAQRATQTLACFAAVLAAPVAAGAVVEPRLRSEREDRWRELFREAGSGELARMQAVDPAFVGEEAARLGGGLRRILDALPGGGSGTGRRAQPHQRGGRTRTHRRDDRAAAEGRGRACDRRGCRSVPCRARGLSAAT